MSTVMTEELLTVEDVASILKKGDGSIKKMLRDKVLKGFKVGGEWRIWTNDLRQYLEDQMAKQHPETGEHD